MHRLSLSGDTTALIISASLAQIGEFSFILAELGVGLNLLPEAGRDLILAGAILSIVLNPLLFVSLADHSAARMAGPAATVMSCERTAPEQTLSSQLTGHTVLSATDGSVA